MPINKETIVSVFDEKLTLMQWLKTINKALDEAVLTGVEVRQKGNATYSFVVTFEDGTELESNEFVLAQGESINGATIRNGHLYLSLTNGDELDAGNLKPVTSFTINASQHLIVNYGDGTSQDLGAIFSGNINIDGILNATKVTGNEIVETMTGYSFVKFTSQGQYYDLSYVGVSKTGNKLTFVIAGKLNFPNNTDIYNIGNFVIPSEIGAKLYPITGNQIAFLSINAQINYASRVVVSGIFNKNSNVNIDVRIYGGGLTPNTDYYFRIEQTFLLSDNMAE